MTSVNTNVPLRVLIVGNLGYIGPILTRHLRRKFPTAHLVGFDNAYFQGCLIDPYENADRLLDEQVYGDIRSISPDQLAGFDSIIALAAISNDPMGNAYEKQTFDINANATFDLAAAAKDAGVGSFIYASSCSVYGAGGSEAKNETSTLNPLTAYAKSKILCEEKLSTISSSRFIVTCLRFSTACGASPRLRLDLVLNDFVASALLNNKIEILSDGTPWRPLINVLDMSRAMEWAIFREADAGGAFLAVNVGADVWNHKVSGLAVAVQKHLPNTEISLNSNAAPDKRSYRVDFSLFKKLAPNHQPQETLASTIEQLMSNIKNSGFRQSDFRNSSLIRLNVLSKLRLNNLLDADLHWLDRR